VIDKQFVGALKKLEACAYGKKIRNSKTFDDVEKKLGEMGLIALPEELKNFLSLMNGLMYSSAEFFSVGDKVVEDCGYKLMDIITANNVENTIEKDDKRLLIGREDEDVYCYNSENGRYEILDRIDWAVMEEFSNLEDMISYVINMR
jgi:hypothetical protein